MMKKTTTALLAICCLTLFSCKEKKEAATKSDTYHETLEVSLSDRTLSTGYSAAISGVQTVEIRPQVSGMITEIMIEEGESVRKGQVLFVIDQTPYKAAHQIATANVKSAEAALSTAELIYQSNKNLFEQEGILTHAKAAEITLDTAFAGVGDLPIHPGAAKYYKEVGVMQ